MFAVRTLALSTAAGPVDVVVKVDAPYQERDAWACVFEIGWPAAPFRRTVHGVDGIQAMLNAMALIGSFLYGSAEHRAGRLSWTKHGGYGFPVPSTMRDELVGFDKEAYG